jgi:hypothetical protein
MNIEEIMARLAEATADELSEALAAIKQEAQGVGTESTLANVEKLEKLRDARNAVLAEIGNREQLAARLDSARGEFTEEPTEVPDEPTEVPTEPETEVSEVETEPETEDTVTASAKLGSITKAAKAKTAPAARVTGGTVTAVTRSTGATATVPLGVQFSRDALMDALVEKHNAISKSTVSGRQTVARIEFSYPESRQLSSDVSASVNTRRIQDAAGPEAITAAGGLCAPLETLYDINVLGVTSRPVRDALSRFQVDRGGIQFRLPMDALVMPAGLGVWTAADDAAVSNPPDGTPEKTCAVIECPGVVTSIVDAIYLCLQYPNFTARFDREWVDATTRAAMVAHARFAENRLLAKLFTGSKLLTAAKVVSAVRDVLVNLDKTIAYYRNRHRLDSMVPLRFILPRWVLDLFRADIARGLATAHDLSALGVADTTIMSWFRARNVNVTFHLDGLPFDDPTDNPDVVDADDIPQQFYDNAAAFSAIPPFINKIDSVLFAEGDWLFLDGGTLDLGLVRDSTLNRTNRYQTFVESWEGAAFNGIESLRLVMEVQPTGSIVGTIDGSALVD